MCVNRSVYMQMAWYSDMQRSRDGQGQLLGLDAWAILLDMFNTSSVCCYQSNKYLNMLTYFRIVPVALMLHFLKMVLCDYYYFCFPAIQNKTFGLFGPSLIKLVINF